jgi:hypothetical protein
VVGVEVGVVVGVFGVVVDVVAGAFGVVFAPTVGITTGSLLCILCEDSTVGPSGRVFPLVKASIKLHSMRVFTAFDFLLVDIIFVL